MNPELQQLKDIHLPPAISMWPTAPGWIVVYIIIACLIAYTVYYWYQWQKKCYAIKYAIKKLNELEILSQHNPDNINIAAEVSMLIRRTALCYFKRDNIAGLAGVDWLNFLNTSGSTTEFTSEIGELLIDVPYRQYHHKDLTPLFALTQQWLAAIRKRIKTKES